MARSIPGYSWADHVKPSEDSVHSRSTRSPLIIAKNEMQLKKWHKQDLVSMLNYNANGKLFILCISLFSMFYHYKCFIQTSTQCLDRLFFSL